MKKLFLIGCLLTINIQATELKVTTIVEQNRATIKLFASQLKKVLGKAMKQDGPLAAIEVCNVKAPEIAELMHNQGTPIARTSLKFRNSSNAPDAWETEVLRKFDKLKVSGTKPKKIEYFEVVTENEKQYLRYMKAIPTGGVCLVCHGENIAPELQKKLTELYPEDKAKGYSLGDLRGAFTIKTEL